jgi:hypothetical protein
MSVDIIVSGTKERASALAKSPVLMEASEALLRIPATLEIGSDEEDAAWGDVALKVKKGERHVESGLTDCFREVKAFEKAFREHMRTAFSLPLAAGVKRIDDASKAWRTEKARAAAAAQREAERVAREAAEAAARAEADRVAAAEARRIEAEQAAAAGLPAPEVQPDIFADEADGFDVAPGVAQTIAPPVERIARGEEAATFERRTLMCSLEDEGEAFRFWGRSAFVFDERAALAALKSDTSDLPAPGDGVEGSVVIGGVRYWNEVSIQRRAR